MGIQGTDVAEENSDIIILKDNFASLWRCLQTCTSISNDRTSDKNAGGERLYAFEFDIETTAFAKRWTHWFTSFLTWDREASLIPCMISTLF
ncbi:hypothetical protein MANES_09G004702v8 [Manihot esculenta]|uniref:Uncharacterized protein n=1 Tax=Manihot esculenta TaxID=3983 RepID=A0ACB7H1C1_MANES|nr:hypothetical protein MANES_09G004702v8 [Manihot esculenta]